MRQAFTGCGTALVTPFTRGGALDETGVRRLARRQIDAGIHFLVPCGTTGETPTLTEAERLRVVELVVAEAKGRVPVLAGAGGYNTHEVIETAQRMARAGADGILSVAPYYNKPTPEGLFQHYKAIAEAVGAADHRLQRARTDRRQRRCRHHPPAERRAEHRRREGSVRQHDADVRDLRRGPARIPRALGRRRADAAGDGGRRPRHRVGRVERSARGDGAGWSNSPRAEISPARAGCTRNCCR